LKNKNKIYIERKRKRTGKESLKEEGEKTKTNIHSRETSKNPLLFLNPFYFWRIKITHYF